MVEVKHVDPKQILVISFTNKAVGELKERINEGLLIPCPITTFHSAGYAILRKQDDIKKQIVGEGFLYNTVNNYLKGNILEQPELVDKLIMFFGSYFDAPYEGYFFNPERFEAECIWFDQGFVSYNFPFPPPEQSN